MGEVPVKIPDVRKLQVRDRARAPPPPRRAASRSARHRRALSPRAPFFPPQALLSEFIGTLFLTLTIVLSSAGASHPGAGGGAAFAAVGLVLGSLIYSFDHVSGAHFNPAVTLGALLNGKIGVGGAAGYVAAQTAGGVAGALAAAAVAGPAVTISPDWSTIKVGPAFAVEALFTFALVLVMQNAAMEKHAREPNSYFGLAIAFTVLAAAQAVNSISGGCFNPAVGTGLQVAALLTQGGSLVNLWIYWLAPAAGAVLATVAKVYMNLPSHQEAEGLPLVVPLTEAIGTFFITLTASLTGEGLATGAMLLAMVYMGDHVCGADYNPAVTMGVALRMSVPLREYWKVAVTMLAQFGGAFLAALVAEGVGALQYPAGDAGVGTPWGAFVFEALWTALLVYVVCAVMTPTHGEEDAAEERKGHSRSFQGLAIGFTVAAGIYCGGKYGGGSGGVFNPALGSAITAINAIFHGDSAANIWVYFAGPFLGSVLGAGAFTALHYHRDPIILDYVRARLRPPARPRPAPDLTRPPSSTLSPRRRRSSCKIRRPSRARRKARATPRRRSKRRHCCEGRVDLKRGELGARFSSSALRPRRRGEAPRSAEGSRGTQASPAPRRGGHAGTRHGGARAAAQSRGRRRLTKNGMQAINTRFRTRQRRTRWVAQARASSWPAARLPRRRRCASA